MSDQTQSSDNGTSCCHPKQSIDYLFWGALLIVAISYLTYFLLSDNITIPSLHVFTQASYELFNVMWWGMVLGVIFVGILSQTPKEIVSSILGKPSGIQGIFRATIAGLIFDLCSHGILMVGMKLYQKGASLGQVMAFLIASPWNSLSLTIVLIGLVGIQWTVIFIVASAIIAIVSGLIFEYYVQQGTLPKSPYHVDLPENFSLKSALKEHISNTQINLYTSRKILVEGIKGSQIVLKWMFIGIILAGIIRASISADLFAQYFGPTLIGLLLTTIAATIIEVCSEGATPIAADIMHRAQAPGNSFAFLMAGVATDYTEIMTLKETTHSWKIALFLPLITLPQIFLLAWIMNHYA